MLVLNKAPQYVFMYSLPVPGIMSPDFGASYISGAFGICIGNRLDIWKTELQAGNRHFVTSQLLDHNEPTRIRQFSSLFRGAAAPVLGYGVLNSILFMTYNRSLQAFDPTIFDPTKLAGVDLSKIWLAGALGGLTSWVVSAPSELIKCRAQLMVDGKSSSYATFVDVWRRSGIRGLYLGGTVTSIRDSFGYGWYFSSYELMKRLLLSRQPDPFADPKATDILMAGGVAGVVTWASVYPLDAVKTRLQTQRTWQTENGLLSGTNNQAVNNRSAYSIAQGIWRTEGVLGLYRGLGVCSLRAFMVNAVQFYTYEKAMELLGTPK